MEEELLENAIQLIIVGTLSLFTFFGAILLFIILYQKKMIRVQKEKQDLENQFQKDILFNYIDTQEKERKRIAADLHDNVGAALAAVKMMINRIKPGEASEERLLNSCKEIIQTTANSTREISHNLLPPSLETLGLQKVLKRMAKNLHSEELEVKINISPAIRMEKRTELNLYRIVQEMVTNTTKYAKATRISIAMQESEKDIQFTYFDNGVGFTTKNSEGLGFKNIQTRVEMIGGTHHFFSEAGKKNGIHIFISKHS